MDQEAASLLKSLEEQAQTWRQRLQDPGMQALITSGKMQVSPLVARLLEAFPQKKQQ